MIVFCHLLNDTSGSPTVLRDAIRALAPAGTEGVLFVGSQGRGVLETAGVPIRRYWYRRSRYRIVTLFTYLASQAALYRALKRARLPDDAIVYVNTLLPFGAALWARRTGRQVVYHLHEVSISPGILRKFLVGIVERSARQVFYVSKDHGERLPVHGVPSTVLHNPAAPAISEAGAATPYAPRRSGRFEVLMLASPRDYKGVPEFLALARRLGPRTDIHFTLVLNADEAEVAQYLPATLPSNLTVHPRTDRPDRFYRTADVLLNLSRPDLVVETFGLTIVEAMCFGLPAIVPPVGGPAEIVTEGRDGWRVDARDGAALEHAVLTLADAPQTALAMSKAARARAQDFTFDRFAAQLRDQVARIADTPPRPEAPQ